MTIKRIKEEPYRSKPFVNMTEDMVRVTFVCPRWKWRELKKEWKEGEES